MTNNLENKKLVHLITIGNIKFLLGYTWTLFPMFYGGLVSFNWKLLQLNSFEPLLVTRYPKDILFYQVLTGAIASFAIFLLMLWFVNLINFRVNLSHEIKKLSLIYLMPTIYIIFNNEVPEYSIIFIILSYVIYIAYQMIINTIKNKNYSLNILFIIIVLLILIPFGNPNIGLSGIGAMGNEDHFIQKAYLAALHYDVLLWDPWQSSGAHSYFFKATGYLNGHTYYNLVTWFLKPMMAIDSDFNYANYPYFRAYFWTWPRLIIAFLGSLGIYNILRFILHFPFIPSLISGIAVLPFYIWISPQVPEEQLYIGGYSLIFYGYLLALKNSAKSQIDGLIIFCIGIFINLQLVYNHVESFFCIALFLTLFSILHSILCKDIRGVKVLLLCGVFSFFLSASYTLPAVKAYYLLSQAIESYSYIDDRLNTPPITLIEYLRKYFSYTVPGIIQTIVLIIGSFIVFCKIKSKKNKYSEKENFIIIMYILFALITATCFLSSVYENLTSLYALVPAHDVKRPRQIFNLIIYPIIFGISINYLNNYIKLKKYI
ncbi:hypothetical protein G6653_04815 [Polynucleobacter paneuropaeus]|jgi:hypothetical protein|nr:hypothetical protein [Polynucleobacter paneuropaeus]MBT8611210.1 hypothetical protein [Polynucleobacter paneuropaeus]